MTTKRAMVQGQVAPGLRQAQPERGMQAQPERGVQAQPERGVQAQLERGVQAQLERGAQAQPERGMQAQPEHRPQPVLWRQPCVDDTDAFLAAVRRSRNVHGRWVKAPSTAQAFAAYCARLAEPANRAYLLLDGSALTAGQRRDTQRRYAQENARQAAPPPSDPPLAHRMSEPLPLVGVINLTNIVRGNFQSGYLGYYAFSGYDGRGWMRAGLQAVIRDAFTALRLHRLEANIQPDNIASLALVQACGFQQEGYSPRYLKIRGRWQDHCRWAILSDN